MTDAADAERTPLLNEGQFTDCTPGFPSEDSPKSALFNEVLQEAIEAINCNIFPERIYQGSSGSYFVKNRDNVSRYLPILLHVSFRSGTIFLFLVFWVV